LKHTNLQLEEEFVIFEKYYLNPNELFFLKLLLLAKEDDAVEMLQRYFKLPEKSRGSMIDILKSLQNKGIILQSYKIPNKGEKFDPFAVELSQNFQKQFFKASFDMGKELYDHYPISNVINGVEYKLRRISKKFNSLEDCFRAYGKYIRWSPDMHKHVLELVDYAKENGYYFTTLDDFVVDNDWNNIEALIEDGTLNMKSSMKQL